LLPAPPAGKPIGVLGHDLDGIDAIGFENPHRSCRADTMAVQENHDFPHRLLLPPGGQNAGSPNRPDTGDLAQAVGRCLNDVEHFLTKGAHELLRVTVPMANSQILAKRTALPEKRAVTPIPAPPRRLLSATFLRCIVTIER
jgi:hypothetical protein